MSQRAMVSLTLVSILVACKNQRPSQSMSDQVVEPGSSRANSNLPWDEKPLSQNDSTEFRDILTNEIIDERDDGNWIAKLNQAVTSECEGCTDEVKAFLGLASDVRASSTRALTAPVSVINLFIAVTGSDDDDGSAQKPWKTIQHGINSLKNFRQEGVKKIVLNIRAGTYFLTETLKIGPADSPPPGIEVFIRNFNQEKVLISGAQKIESWVSHDAAKGIYKAKVNGLRFRKLYSPKSRLIRARNPNLSTERDRGPFFTIKKVNLAQKVIEIEANTIVKWNAFEKVEMVYGRDWITNNLRLKNYQVSNGIAQVEFQEPERNQFFGREIPKARDTDPYFFENAYGFLDAPNEWYLDSGTGTVFLIPNSDTDLSEIFAPVIETLLDIRGTEDSPISRIYIEGLVFSHTTWLKPDTQGLTGGQSIFSNLVNHPPGTIQITNASMLRFEACAVRDIGNQAFLINGKTNKVLFQGNIVENGSANGFVFYGTGSNGDIVADNQIRRMGLDFGAGTGIVVHYGANTRIEHNEIWDIPYAGISVGWGWTPNKTTLFGNRVTNNRIYRACSRMSDCGAIYTISRQDKSYLGENYISDIKRSKYSNGAPVNAIFHDEGSSEFKHAGNVFELIEGEVIRKNKAGAIYMATSARSSEEIKAIAGPRKDRTTKLEAMNFHR